MLLYPPLPIQDRPNITTALKTVTFPAEIVLNPMDYVDDKELDGEEAALLEDLPIRSLSELVTRPAQNTLNFSDLEPEDAAEDEEEGEEVVSKYYTRKDPTRRTLFKPEIF